MKNSWLVSKFAYNMFLYSVWAIVCLGLYIVFEMTHGSNRSNISCTRSRRISIRCRIINCRRTSNPDHLLGMAIYCICRDCSSVGKKIALIVFILFTPPFGAIVYFFTVYRKQWAIHREAAHG